MEEAMICTEDNYGMDGKVNLPNFTEDIDWHGLESLYGVNDSAFERRSNYKLILADWTNYLKDVDRMFALLNNFYEQDETDVNIDIQNESSGAMPASITWVEMALGESYEESSGMAAEKQPTLPVDIATHDSSMVKPSPEGELNNNIPEPGLLNSAHWRDNRAEIWTGSRGFEAHAVEFSGNGRNELEARKNFPLHPNGTLENELLLNSDETEDIFEGQMYLPIELAKSSDHESLNQSVIHQSSGLLKTKAYLSTTNNGSKEIVEK